MTEQITAEMVKRLRDETAAGMMDCKRALQETGGDFDKAREWLRLKNLAGGEKRAGRSANEGLIESYIHMQGRLGVLIELNCETDFVAKTDDFRSLARDVAMHVAAANPRWISRDEVPDDVVSGERKIFEEQARSQNKPDQVIPKIVEGKLEAFYRDHVLNDQKFVKDDSRTVGDLIGEASGRLGEKIALRRMARFKLGEAE